MPMWRCRDYPTRYLANKNPHGDKEFHDLTNENIDENACQVDKITIHGHGAPFGTKEAAIRDGYDPCAHCMPGESTR